MPAGAKDALSGFSALYPADAANATTPDAANDLPAYSRGIFCGATGNLTVVMASEPNNATTVTFNNLAPGQIHPLRVRRVTAFSGTGLVVVY